MAESRKQLLHVVFGGVVKDSAGTEFMDLDKLHVIGFLPNYASALKAWKGASMAQIDHANYKYVIVHLHRLMDPDHPFENEQGVTESYRPRARSPRARSSSS